MKTTNLFAILLAALVSISSAEAVDIDMVPVGNPGNAPDTRYNSMAVGSVANAYQIGKYEVTAGQYTEFLNAVAKDDPNLLYSANMGSIPSAGANIQRTGSSPTYSYSVAADWADRPVNYVTFWDAARFANWLHNDQPTGPQGPGTTEDGAYHDVGNSTLFGRNTGAKFFIPTEDEWYKAAYHDQTAGLAANYFDYSTGTNSVPGNDINETTNPGNNMNFYNNGYAIGGPYYRTVGGEFELSDSPYGTFDQGGNVWEWNETVIFSSQRVLRGGHFNEVGGHLPAYDRTNNNPTAEGFDAGFRVASIPPDALGDYNDDGKVDAADYVRWRKNTANGALPNDNGLTTQATRFNLWRANFGNMAGGGAGEVGSSASTRGVPEPASVVLIAAGLAGVVSIFRGRSRGLRFRSEELLVGFPG